MNTLERYRGCLLGLAVGDATGTAVEFCQPGSFAPVPDMAGGGRFHLLPGEWTDDTSMALCLAESLIERKGFDPVDQLGRYLRWYHEGYLSSNGECFDIGNTVRAALRRFEKSGAPYCGSTAAETAGNGSIMRLAPVPMFYAHDPQQAIEKAAESSRTTHGAPAAIDACRYLSALMVGALNGATKEQLLSERYCPLRDHWRAHPLVPEIDEIAAGSFKRKRPPEIVGSGHVVKSLEAALWAFHSTSDFHQGCLAAVNLGNDADTTAAVYGQLAGAFYGEHAIPEPWRRNLAKRELIEQMAEALIPEQRPK